MFLRFLAAVAAALLPAAAQATQFQADGGIFDGRSYGTHYAGPGGTSPMYGIPYGAVFGQDDQGNVLNRDAFDAYGFYNGGTDGLAQIRQVDLLGGNVFRFFDTFTNNGSAPVSTTLDFFGNLGSDGDELVRYAAGGLVVSCENDGTGACSGDEPVLALVSGNNGLGQAAITPDRYNADFAVTLGAGQSLSLVNFAFLASDAAGTTAQDEMLAQATGLHLLADPDLDGLSGAQIASIANVSAAPEPASWMLMLLGLGASGWALRRRQRVALA